jgi:hypothetical protein
MWVELSHYLANNAGTFDMALIGTKSHLGHLEEDSTVYGFESIAGIRKGAGVDNRVCVLQEGVRHLAIDIDINDSSNGWWGRGCALCLCHGAILALFSIFSREATPTA